MTPRAAHPDRQQPGNRADHGPRPGHTRPAGQSGMPPTTRKTHKRPVKPRLTRPRSFRDDTEEVTGSNPVRPTTFFEILSSAESQDGSQAPAVLPISAGHGAGIPASTQAVPAVSVSLKPIAADAIEHGNHASSRTSRTVNAARHAHIADSVLEVCLGAIPAHGVRIGDSGVKPLPARKGLTGPRLCVTGRNSKPATSAICPHIPDFGAARCADRTRTAGGRSGPRLAASWRGVHRDPAPAVPADHHLPALRGRPGTDHQGEWRGGQAGPWQASWRPAARCSFAGPLLTIGQVPRPLASGLWRMLSKGEEDDRR